MAASSSKDGARPPPPPGPPPYSMGSAGLEEGIGVRVGVYNAGAVDPKAFTSAAKWDFWNDKVRVGVMRPNSPCHAAGPSQRWPQVSDDLFQMNCFNVQVVFMVEVSEEHHQRYTLPPGWTSTSADEFQVLVAKGWKVQRAIARRVWPEATVADIKKEWRIYLEVVRAAVAVVVGVVVVVVVAVGVVGVGSTCHQIL